MFLLRRPSEAPIREYLARQADQLLSYDSVGCTRRDPERRHGWNVDRKRALLGHGEAAYCRAKAAIETWRMFPREIAELCCQEPPRVGLNVAVLYWAAPVRLWILMAARVVYLVNERIEQDGARVERFGFGYGTLADHAERGEERFIVEWNQGDDSVWYDLMAVSQPRHWLARLAYPYNRYEQARFRRLSAAAMQRAVSEPVTMDR
jgi:uncharacterized protein (UPF0548 family)